ncbi:MAG: hypothetical protein PHH77_09245 [Victivallaceae bacterium]|nr:hypothetical protein [Victivallaceae bacterium]
MQDIQREQFEFGSGKVTYKGTFLGESRGAIGITRKTSIHEIKKEAISIVAKHSIVTGIKMEISMTLLATDASVEEFFNLQTLLLSPAIGSGLADTAGELVIQIDDTGEEHTFSNVVIDPGFKRHLGSENRIIDVVFYSYSNS